MKTKSIGFLCEFLKKLEFQYKSVSKSKYDLSIGKILENPDTNIAGKNRLWKSMSSLQFTVSYILLTKS